MNSIFCIFPQNIKEAYSGLRFIVDELNIRNDFRAVFPDIYSIITGKVIECDKFLEPEWIARLAGNFCIRYFQTLHWSEIQYTQDCRAWEKAYSKTTFPTTDAILGFNAHINYDLAFCIAKTILPVVIYEI